MSYLDKNGVSRLWTHIVSRLGDKVDKEDGKTLSSNDYTDADKARLDSFKSVGNETRGIYFNANGEPVAVGCSVKTNVPTGAQFTDTTYTAGDGLTLSADNEFSHSNVVSEKTSFASTATTASANGGKITVTDVKYDAQGHITGSQDRTITLSQEVPTLDSISAAAKEHSHGLVKNDGTLNVSEGNKLMAVDENKKITTWSAETTRNALGLDDRYLGKDVVASSTLGSVKTTSDVTDITDYLAVPIVDGVPYFKKQVQADWNENDSSSDAYVKNRIGGYTKHTTITLTGTGEKDEPYVDLVPTSIEDVIARPMLTFGKTYKVSYNGITSSLDAKSLFYGSEVSHSIFGYRIISKDSLISPDSTDWVNIDQFYREGFFLGKNNSMAVGSLEKDDFFLIQYDDYAFEEFSSLFYEECVVSNSTPVSWRIALGTPPSTDGGTITVTIEGDFSYPLRSFSGDGSILLRDIDGVEQTLAIVKAESKINRTTIKSLGGIVPVRNNSVGFGYDRVKDITLYYQTNLFSSVQSNDASSDITPSTLMKNFFQARGQYLSNDWNNDKITEFQDGNSPIIGEYCHPGKKNSSGTAEGYTITIDGTEYAVQPSGEVFVLMYPGDQSLTFTRDSATYSLLCSNGYIYIDSCFYVGNLSILTENGEDDKTISSTSTSNSCPVVLVFGSLDNHYNFYILYNNSTLLEAEHEVSVTGDFFVGLISSECKYLFDDNAIRYCNNRLATLNPLSCTTGGTINDEVTINGLLNVNSTINAGGLSVTNLDITGTYYPSFTITPTVATSVLNKAVIEGSYDGKLALGAWDDADGKNRRILEVYSKNGNSSLDDALLLRTCENDTWTSYRIFHSGTTVPITSGGTGATTAAGALTNLGAFPISGGTFTGAVMACETNGADLSTAQVRNIKFGTADLVAGESTLAEGEVYFVYE